MTPHPPHHGHGRGHEHVPNRRRSPQPDTALVRFAREYGWRAYAIPVLIVITVWVLWDVFFSVPRAEEATQASTSTTSAHHHPHGSTDPTRGAGPDPATQSDINIGLKDLPPGGPYSEHGDGTYRVVGAPGLAVGEGTEKTIRYVIEVENGVDTASYGGDDALASMIDATLANPKGWTADPRFRFEHVAPDADPNLRIQLTSTGTTHATCGNNLEMETSCFYGIGNRVLINEARWVRGAAPFNGDLGSYRQYLLNHEIGHGLGYAAHEPCGGDGQLAPVMMQQTLSLNNATLFGIDPSEVYPDHDVTCRYNPWPYPKQS